MQAHCYYSYLSLLRCLEWIEVNGKNRFMNRTTDGKYKLFANNVNYLNMAILYWIVLFPPFTLSLFLSLALSCILCACVCVCVCA